jgi:hypothetical protein
MDQWMKGLVATGAPAAVKVGLMVNHGVEIAIRKKANELFGKTELLPERRRANDPSNADVSNGSNLQGDDGETAENYGRTVWEFPPKVPAR